MPGNGSHYSFVFFSPLAIEIASAGATRLCRVLLVRFLRLHFEKGKGHFGFIPFLPFNGRARGPVPASSVILREESSIGATWQKCTDAWKSHFECRKAVRTEGPCKT